MKKSIVYILSLTLLASVFTSCSEDDLNSTSIITADSYTKNEFDKWLEQNFINGYNIEFKYRYEEIESDYDYYTVPADMSASIQMAHLLKYLCVETYDEVAGITFTRSYFPKEFFLIGEWEYRNNGTIILGTAEGGKKILLAGINYLPKVLAGNDVAETLNYYYVKTIHHEFVHILNQTRNYSTDFKVVTGNAYVADSWSEEPYNSRAVYLKRGFISAYAQMEDKEDFAEMLSIYITTTAEQWETELKAAEGIYDAEKQGSVTGRQLIEAKLDIVRAYMFNVWGINIDDLRNTIQRRQADVVAGKVNLTDLTVK